MALSRALLDRPCRKRKREAMHWLHKTRLGGNLGIAATRRALRSDTQGVDSFSRKNIRIAIHYLNFMKRKQVEGLSLLLGCKGCLRQRRSFGCKQIHFLAYFSGDLFEVEVSSQNTKTLSIPGIIIAAAFYNRSSGVLYDKKSGAPFSL